MIFTLVLLLVYFLPSFGAPTVCVHGSLKNGVCFCDENWSLSDCSVNVPPLPPLGDFTMDGPSFWWPQDDMLDISWCNGTLVVTTRTVRSLIVEGVELRLRGGWENMIRPGFSLHFSSPVGGVRVVDLKSSQGVDECLFRERLSQRFFQFLGVPAPRETFARLFVNGTNYGLYTVTEAIGKDFFLARNLPFDDGSSSLWKMGDRKNQNGDTPKTSWANGTLGRHQFLRAKQISENGTVSQLTDTFSIKLWLLALAATDLTANRDSVVLGHNFYLYSPVDNQWMIVFYDQDRSLGQGSTPLYLYDWPLMFCSQYVTWCGRFLTIYADEYRSMVSYLAAAYVKSNLFARDLAVLDGIASQLRPKTNSTSRCQENVLNWMQMRLKFLESGQNEQRHESIHDGSHQGNDLIRH